MQKVFAILLLKIIGKKRSYPLKVYDPQFKIIFPHDFKDKADITEIKLKYKRRFERLF